MNSKLKGDIAEAVFTAECLKRGWIISKPYGDNCRYDAILDRGNGLERIQIKSSTFSSERGVIQSATRRIYNNQTKGQICNSYSKKDIDAFVIYSPELEKLYFVPIDEQENKKYINLRVSSSNKAVKTPKNPYIRWANKYEF
jgi:hypothetical protein